MIWNSKSFYKIQNIAWSMGSQNIATFFFLLLLAPREVNKVAKSLANVAGSFHRGVLVIFPFYLTKNI